MSDHWLDDPNLPLYIGAAIGAGTIIGFFVSYKFRQQNEDTVDGSKVSPVPAIHVKARGPDYPQDPSVKKISVRDDHVSWNAPYSSYNPVDYTAPIVKSQPPWADPDIRTEKCLLQWNCVDGDTDRRSHTGPYKVINGMPRNPVGRTGMCGRGLLGKWGPNHAADPVVTRWKRDGDGGKVLHRDSGQPILQFVAIERKDSGEWAIPGGMVEAGESVSVVLKKEFAEEAMNLLESTQSQKEAIQKVVDEFFTRGNEVYRGYVDDPRNTDNSWMETVAVNFHDKTGEGVGKFHLHAGDDASKVMWTDVDRSLKLYASHKEYINKVAQLHECHW